MSPSKHARSFGDLSIAIKLNLVLVSAITIILVVTGGILGQWLSGKLEERSLADLKRTNQQVVDMIDAYATVLERSTEILGRQFAAPLPKAMTPNDPSFQPAVEGFTQSTGAVATVFVRQGEDFLRIATTLKNEKGQVIYQSHKGDFVVGTDVGIALIGASVATRTIVGQVAQAEFRERGLVRKELFVDFFDRKMGVFGHFDATDGKRKVPCLADHSVGDDFGITFPKSLSL